MIAFLDSFLDTRKKRRYLFALLTFLGIGILAAAYALLANQLLRIQTMDQVFALLERPEITWTYLSRVIIKMLSYASITPWRLLCILGQSLRWWDIVIVFLVVAHMVDQEKEYLRSLRFLLLLLIPALSLCILLIVTAFPLTTLMSAMQHVFYIGIIMFIVSIMYIFFCLYEIVYRILPPYVRLMQYDVIEEVEE